MAHATRGQVFGPRLELAFKLALLALLLGAPALFAYAVWRESAYQALGEPVEQPIPFSHKHHVGDDGIDCRYCHATVETSRHAGLPASSTCLGCHAQLYTDQAVLRPLHESARTGRPIAWRRVHSLPGFVYFDHAVHLAKGVACVECHGRVDQMPLTWRAQPLQMQWCLECHRDPAPRLRARADLFTPAAPRVAPAEAARLAALVGLEGRQRRTDCSTCHR
ncbi:cytochrome c3 family protein [Ramlibacter alkalitolerans]|uniref:Cytochrome c3 family protein n=2 Tax=Ramlibacter alkalitolerans TaxID=2039631 RepID=A0ABS1JIC3_9BURK|nr:cytochrome c3 family protein [Ramlibacter alkalitolerans]